MCVCVYFSLPHVFLASGLALSPSPWLACCPCNVTACSALEWESRRAALLVTSCLRAFLNIFNFFSFVDEDRSSLFLWNSSTLGFSFVWLRMRNEPLAPLVFSGGMFSDSGNVFFGKSVGARLHCTAALRAQSLTFYSLKLFCALLLLFLFSFFSPVAYFTFTHNLSVASVYMQSNHSPLPSASKGPPNPLCSLFYLLPVAVAHHCWIFESIFQIVVKKTWRISFVWRCRDLRIWGVKWQRGQTGSTVIVLLTLTPDSWTVKTHIHIQHRQKHRNIYEHISRNTQT